MSHVNSYTWDDLSVGLRHEFTVSLTADMVNSFRDTTGDINPLHTDDAFARGKGFPAEVVYGLLTTSFYSTLAGVYLPGEHCLLHGVDVTFLAPAFVGDELRVGGEISYLNEAFRQIEIKASINRVDGTRISRAKIKAGLIGETGAAH